MCCTLYLFIIKNTLGAYKKLQVMQIVLPGDPITTPQPPDEQPRLPPEQPSTDPVGRGDPFGCTLNGQ